ncbi:hypothetical protein F2P81_004675 [Scophthalmus maximus]|uniref:EF-hand domain-containing protein n=1 Tax=Scophthalmus maximus TaxID=52904 RepID=A0A6A4TFX8_SCOMX|nr:hypothetical protein F2P81_004675 [Scophthalmus maximus]
MPSALLFSSSDARTAFGGIVPPLRVSSPRRRGGPKDRSVFISLLSSAIAAGRETDAAAVSSLVLSDSSQNQTGVERTVASSGVVFTVYCCMYKPLMREESVDVHSPPVAPPNPFGSGEEDRRLLQSYIQARLKDGQGGPEISSWEQGAVNLLWSLRVFLSTVSDVHQKIRAAFDAFDYEANSTVDVREIGTIIYSLGCFPSQKDLHDFIAKVEEDHTGYIHLDKFLPAMTKVLQEHKFPPISEDLLLQAFEALDKEKKDYLDPEELTKYMTQEGEPFTQEEMEEMLTALADHRNQIHYKDVVSQMTIKPDK